MSRIALCTVLVLLVLLVVPSAAQLSGYNYSQSCNLSVTGQTNYQVRFDVFNGTGTSSGKNIYLNGHVQQWGTGVPIDIRFTDPSDTLLPFWVENVSTMVNASHSIIWVNVTNTTQNVTVWYGNASVASASNTTSGVVFPLFDHFDTSLQTALWDTAGTPTVSASVERCTGSASDNYIQSKGTFNNTLSAVRMYGKSAHFGGATYFELMCGHMYVSSSLESSWFNNHPTAGLTGYFVTEPGDDKIAAAGIAANQWSIYEQYRNSSVVFGLVNESNTKYLATDYPIATNNFKIRPIHESINAGADVYCDWVMVRTHRQAGEPTPNTWGEEGNFTMIMPTAQFTTNVSYANASGWIQFTDSSLGSPTSWAWNFGDGTANNTTANPNHRYTAWIANTTAQYNTTLTATNALGSNTTVKTNNVTISPIGITWTANSTSGIAPKYIRITPVVTNGTVSDGYFTWTTTGANWTNTGSGGVLDLRYDSTGTYDITLNATSQPGTSYNWSTKAGYLSVVALPIVTFTANKTGGSEPTSVKFTDTSLNVPTSWSWTYTNVTGDNINTEFSTEQSPVHSFTAGNYSILLYANNVAGTGSSTQTTWVNVTPPAPPTPTPTPTPTPPPSGGVGAGGATSPSFPTTTSGNIHINSVTDMGHTKVAMSGNVDDTGIDNVTWFIVGTSSNHYSYFTNPIIPDASGVFTVNITGLPLLPGKQYFVRAASPNGRSAEELNVTLTAIAAGDLPSTNFGQYFQGIQNADKNNPLTMVWAVLTPMADGFGGGVLGWQIVWTILIGLPLVIMAVRQDNIYIVGVIAALIAGGMFTLIVPELQWIVYVFIILAAAVLVYRLFKRE